MKSDKLKGKKIKGKTSSPSISKELRELLARREDSFAEVLKAEAEVARHRAKMAKIRAELLRADKSGSLSPEYAHSW